MVIYIKKQLRIAYCFRRSKTGGSQIGSILMMNCTYWSQSKTQRTGLSWSSRGPWMKSKSCLQWWVEIYFNVQGICLIAIKGPGKGIVFQIPLQNPQNISHLANNQIRMCKLFAKAKLRGKLLHFFIQVVFKSHNFGMANWYFTLIKAAEIKWILGVCHGCWWRMEQNLHT